MKRKSGFYDRRLKKTKRENKGKKERKIKEREAPMQRESCRKENFALRSENLFSDDERENGKVRFR